jgi:hypothetical protein
MMTFDPIAGEFFEARPELSNRRKVHEKITGAKVYHSLHKK